MAVSTMSISEGPHASLNSPDLNVYSTAGATSHNSSRAKSTVKSGNLLRLAALGLGLLCAILLTATIALCVLNTRERGLEMLNARNCKDYRGQLQRDYINLSNEKSQLQENCTSLSHEKDQLQEKWTSLSNEKDQLQRDYNRLSNEKNQLQGDYNRLSNEKKQLQRDYNSHIGQCRTCPEGWEQLSSKCYFFSDYTPRKNWEGSRQYCKLQGADLVIINSQEEQEFIDQHTKATFAWIGLKLTANGLFEWVDGTALQQAFWYYGRPSSSEHCVKTGYDLLWTNQPCSKLLGLICETDASCVCNKKLSKWF